MGRPSKIESHADWRTIVKRLASGDEYSRIIQDFPELTWFDLDYYTKNKLPELLAKSPELRVELEGEHGNDTLSEVRALKTRAIEILAAAQGAGDLRTALLGIREARNCLELCLKAEGKIRDPNFNLSLNQVNINECPEWIALRTRILTALSEFPHAREAVVLAISSS